MIDKLLLAADGSERSLRAASVAGELAGRLGAELVILAVDDQEPLSAALKTFAKAEGLTRTQVFDAILASARAAAEAAGAANIETRVGVGDPTEAILDAAARVEAGMIVMGSHGYGALAEMVRGSISHDVEREAAVPCVITH